MAWKKRFAPSVPIGRLPEYGPMRIETEPETLPQGRFRVVAHLKDGGKVQFTTYEGTIGNILEAQGEKGHAEAYLSEDTDTKGNPYVNWKTA